MEEEMDYTAIEAYVKGELTEKDTTAFEQQLQQDTDLKKEVEFYENMAQVVSWQGLFEEAAAEMEGTKTEAKVVTMKQKRPFRRYLAIAATFAVLVIGGIFLWQSLNSSTDQQFANYFDPYPNDIAPITKGGGVVENDLVAGLQAYERGEYAAALSIFQNLTPSDTVQFYSSMIAMEQDNMEDAIEQLTVLATSESDFQLQAEWYLALAALKQSNIERAVGILERIQANNRHPFRRKAADLLAEL